MGAATAFAAAPEERAGSRSVWIVVAASKEVPETVRAACDEAARGWLARAGSGARGEAPPGATNMAEAEACLRDPDCRARLVTDHDVLQLALVRIAPAGAGRYALHLRLFKTLNGALQGQWAHEFGAEGPWDGFGRLEVSAWRGALVIERSPADASLRVNGWEVAETGTSVRLESLLPGSYRVSADHHGYASERTRVELRETVSGGTEATVRVALARRKRVGLPAWAVAVGVAGAVAVGVGTGLLVAFLPAAGRRCPDVALGCAPR